MKKLTIIIVALSSLSGSMFANNTSNKSTLTYDSETYSSIDPKVAFQIDEMISRGNAFKTKGSFFATKERCIKEVGIAHTQMTQDKVRDLLKGDDLAYKDKAIILSAVSTAGVLAGNINYFCSTPRTTVTTIAAAGVQGVANTYNL